MRDGDGEERLRRRMEVDRRDFNCILLPVPIHKWARVLCEDGARSDQSGRVT